jgi:hypothetical protein
MTDPLKNMWAALGVSFVNYEREESFGDPERAILALVQSGDFPKDRKMMTLALLWLSEYSEFVHIERLKTLSASLNMFELSILGAMALKCENWGDHRWRSLLTAVRNRLGKKAFEFSSADSKSVLNRLGVDPEFSVFGIKIAPVDMAHQKKIRLRNWILKNNLWLKNRLLFGTNLRADMATVLQLNLAQTAYKASKILMCSANAAYRNWNALKEAGWCQS